MRTALNQIRKVAALLLLLLPGCSKPASPAPATQSTPAAEAANPADMTATLATLTQALRKYSIENKRVPATFEELITAGYVSNPPPAPPGQKFAVNPKGVQVILVKQ
jgi:membrane-bound lytic murein transglycosylase B